MTRGKFLFYRIILAAYAKIAGGKQCTDFYAARWFCQIKCVADCNFNPIDKEFIKITCSGFKIIGDKNGLDPANLAFTCTCSYDEVGIKAKLYKTKIFGYHLFLSINFSPLCTTREYTWQDVETEYCIFCIYPDMSRGTLFCFCFSLVFY